MKRPTLGVVFADDFTGATDVASMRVRAGMRTMQVIGVPDGPAPADADAVVVALKSRTTPSADAVRESVAALGWLQATGRPLLLALKSGNFGSVDFFQRAFEATA